MPEFSQSLRLFSPRMLDVDHEDEPADDDVVTFDLATEKWRAEPAPAGGVTDHGLLSGRDDDDHTLYALADKTRPAVWVGAADLAVRSLADLGTIDHDLLDGLLDDDHTIYGLLSGRSGGQTLKGGLAASEYLTLQSTAHATRGYVRAQDDLQLLSNILRDSGGNERATLATALPHVKLTGDVQITANLGVRSAPAAAAWINITPAGEDVSGVTAINVNPANSTMASGLFVGVAGQPVASITSGGSGNLYALAFNIGVGGGGNGATCVLRNIYNRIIVMAFNGTVNEMVNYRARSPWVFADDAAVTVSRGLHIENQGASAKIVDVESLKIDDITLNTGHRYLMEVGPASPYLRLLGGANPAANQSNLLLKLGATLKLVHEYDADSAGVGYRALRVLN